MRKKRVILVTDGDKRACRVLEYLAARLELRCISASAGNPTPLTGCELVQLIHETPRDPVLVMFDDKGSPELGKGELAMYIVATDESIEVIGAIAVASNSFDFDGVKVDFCIDRDGNKVYTAVDKGGRRRPNRLFGNMEDLIIRGDTVDILNYLNIPIIVGIGDIGKMELWDDTFLGSPVTRRAIKEILSFNKIEIADRPPKFMYNKNL